MQSHVTINGIKHEVSLDTDRTLLVYLREELDLTGTKLGCGEGECSACAVLVGSHEYRACVTPLADVVNQQVTTIEGMAEDGYLHPVQQAFLEEGAMQCGYCTAGWIMGTAALLNRTPSPTDSQLDVELAGHACRCCTYPRIRKAVHRAAELMKDPELFEDQPPLKNPVSPESSTSLPWDLTVDPDRHFFSVLGDGLVCLYPPDLAIDRPELKKKPRKMGGTWIHISPTVLVSAFSGKVEIGQGTRTALAMLVAEELRIPATSVAMIMGDTAISPFDAGTSGSMSMIEIGESIRHAAALTRETLLDLGSTYLGLDAEKLTISLGWISGPGDERRVSWSDLLTGMQRLEIVTEHASVTPPTSWTVAGQSTLALTTPDVVTGRKRYPYDVVRPGMVYAKILRAPAYGATMRSVTLPDPASISPARIVRDEDFIGAVGPTTAEAIAALSLVDAQWDLTPQPSEDELEQYLRDNEFERCIMPGGFVNALQNKVAGDVDLALSEAEIRVTTTYTAAYIAHAPLEPRSAVAEWEGDHLTLWMGTQRPFPIRKLIAEYFDMSEQDVRIIVPDFGSGFGGKHLPDVGIEAARLARVVGAPVKLQWTRAEEFDWAYFRPAAVIDIDAGETSDGQITAWKYKNLNSGPGGLGTPYEIENQDVTYQPSASPLAHGSYRALAATANNFARESHMDELAHRAGIDPLEFRLRHTSNERLRAVFQRVADHIGWTDYEKGPGVGIGSTLR